MKVFVAGGSGAIGQSLIRMLVEKGHSISGMTQSEAGASRLRAVGAEPVIADALDSDQVMRAVAQAQPEVIINQLTSLPKDPSEMPTAQERDAHLRLVSGASLISATKQVGVQRYIQQSSAFFLRCNEGLADEQSQFATDASPRVAMSARMYDELERTVHSSGLGAVILRYGFFYGPATWYEPQGGYAAIARAGQFPIIDRGQAVWSWIHLDDAASATVAALEIPEGTYNIVDDDPSPVSAWLPAFARSIGAPAPPVVSLEEALALGGPDGVFYGTQLIGASNAKAKKVFGFQPRRLEWL